MALANATAAAGPYDFTVQATTSVDLDVPPVAAEPLVAPELSVPNEDPSLSTGERLAELAAASLAASRDIDRAIEAAQERADQAASSVQQDWGSGIDNLQLQAAVEQIQSDLPAIVESQRARADTAVAMLSTRGRATNNAMATLTTGRQADLAAAQDAVSAFATQVDSASTELVVLEQAMSPRSVVVQSTNSGVYRPAGDTTGQPQVSFGVATSQGLLLIEQPDDDLALDPISIIESPDDVLALLQVATPISRDSFTVDLGELDGTPDPLADLQWQGTVQTEDEVLDGLVLTGRGGPTTVDIFVDLDQL